VNPVIPEVVNQVAFEVIGNDVAVSFAAEAGQLQLNAFEPVIAASLFGSLAHLRNACLTLETNCVRGITADREQMRRMVEGSVGLATALNPYIGYERSSAVAREAYETGESVYSLVLAKGWLSAAQLDAILTPEVLTAPRPIARPGSPGPGGR